MLSYLAPVSDCFQFWTSLALATKFAHLISNELFLKMNCHGSSICCQLINLLV